MRPKYLFKYTSAVVTRLKSIPNPSTTPKPTPSMKRQRPSPEYNGLEKCQRAQLVDNLKCRYQQRTSWKWWIPTKEGGFSFILRQGGNKVVAVVKIDKCCSHGDGLSVLCCFPSNTRTFCNEKSKKIVSTELKFSNAVVGGCFP
jgi:hypothetical protein